MVRKVRMNRKPNFLKARLFAPFSHCYRDRLSLEHEPEVIQVISPHTIHTRDGKLAYVKNSKAGCTTVAEALYFYERGQQSAGKIHREADVLLQGHNHVRAGLSALRSPEVYKFTFVRNPINRSISAFTNFVLQGNNPSAHKVQPYLRTFGLEKAGTDSKKFDVFLDYVEASFEISEMYTDPHFRLQTLNIGFPIIRYNRIARLEEYQKEFAKLLKEAGAWRDEILPVLQNKKNSSSKGHRFEPTSAQVERVRRIYDDDFHAFGYD